MMVATTSVTAEPGGSGFGENVQLAFAGSPEQVKCKAVTVAGTGVMVMWTMAGCPAVTLTGGNVGAMAKSSSELIANVCETPAAGL